MTFRNLCAVIRTEQLTSPPTPVLSSERKPSISFSTKLQDLVVETGDPEIMLSVNQAGIYPLSWHLAWSFSTRLDWLANEPRVLLSPHPALLCGFWALTLGPHITTEPSSPVLYLNCLKSGLAMEFLMSYCSLCSLGWS